MRFFAFAALWLRMTIPPQIHIDGLLFIIFLVFALAQESLEILFKILAISVAVAAISFRCSFYLQVLFLVAFFKLAYIGCHIGIFRHRASNFLLKINRRSLQFGGVKIKMKKGFEPVDQGQSC